MREAFYDFDLYDIPEHSKTTKNEGSDKELIVFLRKGDWSTSHGILSKILGAIGFSEGQNASIITLDDNDSINVSNSIGQNSKYVICFGLMPKEIGFNAAFIPNRFYATEGFKVLLSYSLESLTNDVDKKRKLWATLQATFKKEK